MAQQDERVTSGGGSPGVGGTGTSALEGEAPARAADATEDEMESAPDTPRGLGPLQSLPPASRPPQAMASRPTAAASSAPPGPKSRKQTLLGISAPPMPNEAPPGAPSGPPPSEPSSPSLAATTPGAPSPLRASSHATLVGFRAPALPSTDADPRLNQTLVGHSPPHQSVPPARPFGPPALLSAPEDAPSPAPAMGLAHDLGATPPIATSAPADDDAEPAGAAPSPPPLPADAEAILRAEMELPQKRSRPSLLLAGALSMIGLALLGFSLFRAAARKPVAPAPQPAAAEVSAPQIPARAPPQSAVARPAPATDEEPREAAPPLPPEAQALPVRNALPESRPVAARRPDGGGSLAKPAGDGGAKSRAATQAPAIEAPSQPVREKPAAVSRPGPQDGTIVRDAPF
jgi:hypothetical protein